MGCSPLGREESDTTERLHFHFSLSCIGEGNGSPPQCSCLESPRDRGAWWAAIYGVAQSRTRLKRLSISAVGDKLFHETWAFNTCIHAHAYILILRFDAHSVRVLGRNVWKLWPPDAKS